MNLFKNMNLYKNQYCRRIIKDRYLVIFSGLLVLGMASFLFYDLNIEALAQQGPTPYGEDQESYEGENADDQDALDQSNEEVEGDIPMPPPEQITVPAEKMFHMETSVGTQSVFNGNVPVHVYIKPFIDSSKAQLEWTVPRGLNAMSSKEVWFKLQEDEPKTFTLYVSPARPGRYEIIANVTAWRYDTNYVDSIVIEINIDNNLLITPQTPEYNRNMIFKTVGSIVAVGVTFAGIFFLGKFGMEKLNEMQASRAKKAMEEDQPPIMM